MKIQQFCISGVIWQIPLGHVIIKFLFALLQVLCSAEIHILTHYKSCTKCNTCSHLQGRIQDFRKGDASSRREAPACCQMPQAAVGIRPGHSPRKMLCLIMR